MLSVRCYRATINFATIDKKMFSRSEPELDPTGAEEDPSPLSLDGHHPTQT
jgi:hypothetical protein